MAVQIERNNLIGDGVFYVEKNNAINYVPLVIVEISGVLEVVQFDPPTNIRETGDSESSVTWEWTAAKHATEYQYQTRLGALGRWSAESVVTGTSVTITSLASDSSYDIRVRSKNSTLLGAWSSPVSGTTDVAVPPPVTDPVTPSTPIETADSSDSITWEWSSHSENTGGHEWGLRTGGGNAFRSSSQSSNRLTTDNLTPSATYQLRVRGLRHGRRSAWSAWGTGTTAAASSEPEPEPQPITPPVTTPTTQRNPVTPTRLRNSARRQTAVTWQWNSNSNNTSGYEWEFRAGTSGDATNSGTQANTVFTRTGLDPDTTYGLRVRGKRGAKVSGWTAWVSAKTDAIPVRLPLTSVPSGLRIVSKTLITDSDFEGYTVVVACNAVPEGFCFYQFQWHNTIVTTTGGAFYGNYNSPMASHGYRAGSYSISVRTRRTSPTSFGPYSPSINFTVP